VQDTTKLETAINSNQAKISQLEQKLETLSSTQNKLTKTLNELIDKSNLQGETTNKAIQKSIGDLEAKNQKEHEELRGKIDLTLKELKQT
jgi:uncharacterized protein YhaN